LAEQHLYIPGDLLLVGVVPIYGKGNGPMECGELRTSLARGFEMAEGMVYAVDNVNANKGQWQKIFLNQTIGLIVLNSCNNVLVVQRQLLEIHEKGLRLRDGSYLTVQDRIMGYIGEYSSTITIAMSTILTRLAMIQMSPVSSASSLSDRSVHPYFMRVAIPDTALAATILNIAKALSADYIQLVHCSNDYCQGAAQQVQMGAKVMAFCIAQVQVAVEGQNYSTLFENLRRFVPAKVVVVILDEINIQRFVDVVDEHMYLGEFVIIGATTWARNWNVIVGKYKLEGAITIAKEMAFSTEFTDHLRSLVPSPDDVSNPWMQPYMEQYLQCYYKWSYDKSYTRECGDNDRIGLADDFHQNQYTPSAMNSVYAFLDGASNAFEELCGSGTDLCANYKEHPLTVIGHMKHVMLDIHDTGEKVRVFDDNGDGNDYYNIYSVQRNPDNPQTMTYVKVSKCACLFNVNILKCPDEHYRYFRFYCYKYTYAYAHTRLCDCAVQSQEIDGVIPCISLIYP
jgi:hypothetical protein